MSLPGVPSGGTTKQFPLNRPDIFETASIYKKIIKYDIIIDKSLNIKKATFVAFFMLKAV
jgi:hypothetical protein